MLFGFKQGRVRRGHLIPSEAICAYRESKGFGMEHLQANMLINTPFNAY